MSRFSFTTVVRQTNVNVAYGYDRQLQHYFVQVWPYTDDVNEAEEEKRFQQTADALGVGDKARECYLMCAPLLEVEGSNGRVLQFCADLGIELPERHVRYIVMDLPVPQFEGEDYALDSLDADLWGEFNVSQKTEFEL